ncbi:MAG TPA: acyltransferase [Pseudonocardiaceae bacterium]|nr:acyltransferase [Pseudonocardiaceae bacterium]
MSSHLDVIERVHIPRRRPGRDPFIDLLRNFSMLAVVLGHWIMPMLGYTNRTITVGDSLSTPGWWTLTWALQVMPVFFAVGGAANFHSYSAHLAAGGDARGWLATRLYRLTVPVLPLLFVWLAAPPLLTELGLPRQPVTFAAGIVGQLLWFLAVYLITVALAPLMIKLRDRFGLAVPVALAIAAIVVDSARFSGVPLVGYLNEGFVWLALQQLGIEYAAGRFTRLSTSDALVIGIGGFAATALLVVAGPYPASMVGLPGQAVSNMSPATLCLLTLGVGQLGLLLAARRQIVAFSRAPKIAALQRLIGPRCMTVYLWHMTAMIIVAGVTVVGLGYTTPAAGSLGWFLVTPLWIGALALVLRGLLVVFGRFETARLTIAAGPSTPRLVAALLLLFAGLLDIAAQGFAAPIPAVLSIAAILASLAITRKKRSDAEQSRRSVV